jgi:hypothetical protein
METIVLIRDLAIIVLALVSIVVGILMVILILEIRSLVNVLERDLGPILESVNETAATVRGTASFVSEQVVKPLAGAFGVIAGARGAFRVLLNNHRRSR